MTVNQQPKRVPIMAPFLVVEDFLVLFMLSIKMLKIPN